MVSEASRLTLILGGARSGKSAFAERLARTWGDSVLYVATAVAGDAEMANRIAAHQRDRPSGWRTLEATTGVGFALQPHLNRADCVLIDSITLLVSNVLLASEDRDGNAEEGRALDVVSAEIESLVAAVEATPKPVIVVSDEVGLGLVPTNPLGRHFRDALGLANQRLAEAASSVYWVMAGIPVDLRRFQADLTG